MTTASPTRMAGSILPLVTTMVLYPNRAGRAELPKTRAAITMVEMNSPLTSTFTALATGSDVRVCCLRSLAL